LYTGSDLEIFFSDFEIISDLSCILLDQIENVLTHWPVQTCLGRIFLANIPLFKLYVRYIRSFNKVNGRIQKLSGTQGFLDWVKTTDIKESEFKVFGNPVKRPKEYERLLKALQSFQPPEHVELPTLEAAVKGMTYFNTMLEGNEEATLGKAKSRTLSVETISGTPPKKLIKTDFLGTLKVSIISARNLPLNLKRLPSAYVELRFNKLNWTTAIVKKETAPHWKETFLLPVPFHFKAASATTLCIEVFNTSLVGKEEIGSVVLIVEDLIATQSSPPKFYHLSHPKAKQSKDKDKDKEKAKQVGVPEIEIQFEFIAS